jgi:beta-glucanase (GH16 family)
MLARAFIAFSLAVIPALAQSGWKLVWSDEFNGSSIDRTKWNYDTGTGWNGWGNNELQYYTDRPDNARIENGNLVIEARKEEHGGRQYTSGRLVTKGKFSRTYGRFEARIKVPFGQGILPAFWMLGNDGPKGWPECGEIDIMEVIGKEPANVYGTIHGPGYSGASSLGGKYSLPVGAKLHEDFHVYAVEWEPGTIRWYFDGALFHTRSSADLPAGSKWVFDHPFHILLNLAVGGNWPGYPDATTRFPQFLTVDYVRVFERPPTR